MICTTFLTQGQFGSIQQKTNCPEGRFNQLASISMINILFEKEVKQQQKQTDKYNKEK